MKKGLMILVFICFFLLGFSYTSKVFSEEEVFMRMIKNDNGVNIIKVYAPSNMEKIYLEIYDEQNKLMAGIYQDYYSLEKYNGRIKNTYIINSDYINDADDISIVLFPGTEREDVFKMNDFKIIDFNTAITKNKISGNSHIRVMSYNIHHGKNSLGADTLDNITDTIRDNQADIIGLQEVDKNVYRTQFKNQVKLMASELGMYYAFGSNIEVMGMEYGNAILSKYPIKSFENVHMPGFKEKRGLLRAEIKIDGKDMNFLVTHLGLTKQERTKQVKTISEYIKFLGTKTIIVGDFNSKENNEEMNSIKTLMVDSSQGKREHFKNTYEGLIIKSKIDYIFVSPDIKVNKYNVIDTNESDHFPIIANIEL